MDQLTHTVRTLNWIKSCLVRKGRPLIYHSRRSLFLVNISLLYPRVCDKELHLFFTL